jgi:Zn-dependent metalloprotease
MKSNGLRTFAAHALDDVRDSLRAAVGLPLAAVTGTVPLESLDAESAARHYLERALASDQVPGFQAAPVNGRRGEFKSLGVETIPLTGTQTVKFRQHYEKVPVYGSLVTVELDERKQLLALTSALGEPHNVDPTATVAPAEALATVARRAGYSGSLRGAAARLHYYFDGARERWRLAYIVKDVLKSNAAAPDPVPSQTLRNRHPHPLPELFDFVVDAHTGELVAELPRTQTLTAPAPPTAVATDHEEAALDGLGVERRVLISREEGQRLLKDVRRNVHTHDFAFQDAYLLQHRLPGQYVSSPPAPWDPAAVSAHANASEVAAFVADVLKRNGLDNAGGPYLSTINCVYQSSGGREWRNAAWIGTQMIYGQRMVNGELRSYAVACDVVAHEIMHGLTDHTARLEYAGMSGALNESYSDILGILVSNHGRPVEQWNWQLGEDLDVGGVPIRDISQPARHDQPEHMRDYQDLPVDRFHDWGGVHINSGIHNKAAYNLLTMEADGTYLLSPESVAALYYLALTQHLSRTSGFSDSRRALLAVARTLFRDDPNKQAKLAAVAGAFTAVGIE